MLGRCSFVSLSLVCVAAALASLGCAGAKPVSEYVKQTTHVSARLQPPESKQPKSLTAERIAEVRDVIGPYVGKDGDLSLLAWAEAGGAGRNLVVAALDSHGKAGATSRVGNLAGEVDLVLVRGFGDAAAKLIGQPRFALVTTRRADQKTRIDVTAIKADGSALWGPTTLAERSARVLWVGFVVTGQQPLLLWAEQDFAAKAEAAATLYALPVDGEGRNANPVSLGSHACVWQTAVLGGQAALASMKAGPSGCTTGSISLELLGATGKAEKSVELAAHAGLDLDLTAGSSAFVLAWADRDGLEPRITTALLDRQGKLLASAPGAVPALGEQAVVALIPGASASLPAFLVWERIADRPEGARFFEVAALDQSGRASGAGARLLYERLDGSSPELVPYAGGVAALTLAPACAANDPCEGGSAVPTFVALDSALKLKASEPLLLDQLGGRAADLGWGLTCAASGCFALAAQNKSPSPLFAVSLPARLGAFRAAAEEATPSTRPRVASSQVLLRAPSALSQLAFGAFSGSDLAGYVTDFDPTTPWQKLTKPAEDGRLEPLRARVAVRAFANTGSRAPLGDESVISLRAHSIGGLSLLADPAGKGGLAIWTGLDKGEPQVFLTELGADGKRGQQKMLTRKPGEMSDVAALGVDGGYLVAWVDERSGDSEVYTARVARGLQKVGQDQRITTATGAASDLLLTHLAGRPFAVWADTRVADQPGWADIYGAFIKPADGARDGSEVRLSSTRPHSFSPHVADLGNTSVLAWLEAADDATPASVRVAPLTASGELDGNVSVVPLPSGTPRGLGMDCDAKACKLAVTLEVEGRGELHGFEWRPGAEARVVKLAGLGSPAAASVAPVVRGSQLYVADQRDRQGFVRRLDIEW